MLTKSIIKLIHKNFIVRSNVAYSYTKVKDLKNREPMYVLDFVSYVIISIIQNYNLMNNG